MKKSEINVGGHYLAKVSGALVTVRVDGIVDHGSDSISERKGSVTYDVTNLKTKRKTIFRSAQKFRRAVSQVEVDGKVKVAIPQAVTRKEELESRAEAGILRKPEAKELERLKAEGEQGSDPTPASAPPLSLPVGAATASAAVPDESKSGATPTCLSPTTPPT